MQELQCEGGLTIDWPAGRRSLQTLRKLPMARPMTAKIKIAGAMVIGF